MSENKIQSLKDSADRLFSEGKFKEALRRYKEVLQGCSALEPVTVISVASRVVTCLYRTQQYPEALEELESVAKIFERDSYYRARLELEKLRILLDLGDYRKTLEVGEAVLKTLRDTVDNESIARVHRILGIAYLSSGDLSKAKIFFEDALSTFRRINDEHGILDSHNNLAQLCFIDSQWHRAVDYLRDGLRTSKNLERKEWIASFSLNLGMIHGTMGDWSSAKEYLDLGVGLSENLGHILDTIRGKISLAALARLQRQWDVAVQMLEECARLCEKEGYKRELYLCYEGLGEVHFDRQDLTRAQEYYLRAFAIAEEAAPQGDMAVEIRRRLADLSNSLDAPEQALKHATAALRIARKLGDKYEEACIHRALATAHTQLHKLQKAQSAFTRATKLLEELGERYERAKTLLACSTFLAELDRGDEAIQHLLRAEELFESLPSQYWMGWCELEIARMRFSKGGADLAIISLDRATELFARTAEQDALSKVAQLRELVEKAMVETSLRASEDTIPSDSPENLLGQLVHRTDAARAFVVLFDNGDLEIAVTHNFKTEDVREFSRSLCRSAVSNPMIATNLQFNKSVSLPHRNGIRSFILIPFGPEGERGLLYLDKACPFTQRDLTLSVRIASSLALTIAQIRQSELKAENLRLRRELEARGFAEIVTQDSEMLEILGLVEKLKDDSAPVLIEGETGTGKELIARAIHFKGLRATKPFIALDCGAIPDALAENELFGHKKGSFTDAKEDKPGLFELANGGTLFLDEVSNLSVSTQAKLLRVLQEGRVRRIGETKERKVDVRIIAASNRSLENEMSEGRFRQDLYHRLKVVEISLPALRERKQDIPLLVHHFIDQFSSQRKRQVEGITSQALCLLSRYEWPGNVRQLKNEIERAIVLLEEGAITPTLFSAAIRGTGKMAQERPYSIREILRVLKENNWVKRKAARILGMPESTLRRRLKVHNLKPPARS